MKKTLALILAVVMVFGLVACSRTEAPSQAEAPAQAETPAKAEAPAAEEAASTEAPAEREAVTLKFYSRAAEQPDQQRVFDELNKYFQEKFNTTVEWGFLGGTYSDKINVIINSGEEYDACFTADWQNSYLTNVSRDAFLDITELLQNYPDLYNSMPEAFWDAVKVEGSIYAVPNQQIAARTPHVGAITEYLEAYGWTADDLAGKKISDLTDFAKFCLDNYGAHVKGIEASNLAEYCGYEFINGPTGALAVKVGDTARKVVNLYGTSEFADLCNEMRALYEAGYVDSQMLLNSDYHRAEMIAGRDCCWVGGTYKPGGDIDDSLNYGIGISHAPYGKPLLSTSGIIATMWGISSNTKHPDRVLEILEALSTDPYVMQMICYGIEGVHYDVVDGFMRVREDCGYSHGQSWAFGNTFLTIPAEGMPADVWEKTKEINDTADVSVLMGFTYNLENVELEMTNISNVYNSYKSIITGELPVDSALAEFNSKLEEAGIQTAIDDAQAQIDTFFGG